MQKAVTIAIAVIAVAAIVGSGVYVYALVNSGSGSSCPSTTATVATPSPVPAAPAAAAPAPIQSPAPPRVSANGTIQVVAAENFWGSLVSQLGGSHVSVLSIVTDPNADPHEYEANTSDAIAISNAQFVIVNGVGYDDWALELIASANTPGQVVLNVGDLNGVSISGGIVSGNPHMWYNPVYVNRTIAAMYSDLVSIQPSGAGYFQQQYATLNASLATMYSWISAIKAEFGGTMVASTESIFVYLANATDLDLVSPPAFMEAIAEGNDPPTQSVVTFQCQLESGTVSVLVYNEQTVTPITTTMKALAAANNVTVVGVTETIQPSGVTFQTWMTGELLSLYNALNAQTLGQ